jgi:hypothetical protein
MAKDDEIFDLDNLDKANSKISVLITRLNEADAELVNLSKNALLASKNLASINTPGGLGKSQGDNAKTLAELEKLKQKYTELEKRIIKLNEARKKANDLSFQEKIDARIRLQDATLNAKAVSDEADAYQKLAAKLALAQKEAQAIGATWGSDSVQFKKASDAVKKLDDEIKKIDAGIGKHQRNVGNYASGWNALGNSVNQITREAPAAAVSMNTFFLAISNNLPAFFDAIQNINEENRKLASEGKQTTSVWKQLAGAVFSFQTLLSVGVTLLTLYGGKIIELISGMGNLEAQLKKVEAQQERYNRQLEDANRNIEHNLTLEKNRRKLLGQTEADLIDLDKEAALQKLKNYEITRDANKKLLDDRIAQVVKEKNVANTGYVYEIGISEKLKNDKIRIEKLYNEERRKAAYAQDKATRDASGKLAKQYQDELSAINFKIKTDNALTEDEIFAKRRDGYIKANNEAILYGQKVSELFSDLKLTAKEDEDERLANLAEMNRKDIELLIEKNNAILDNEDLYYSDRFKALDEDFRLRKRLAELDRDEDLRLAKNSYEKQQTALLNFQIENLKLIKDYAKKRADLEKLDLDQVLNLGELLQDIDKLNKKDILKSLSDSGKNAQKELEKVGKQIERMESAMLKLQSATTSWVNSFTKDVFQSAGVGSIQSFFDDTFKNLLKGATTSEERFAVYFNSIAESAQEAFNFINQLSASNFESEKVRLEEQYNVALKYAGDNKEAQEKLNADLEKQKKDIAIREAKAKKQQALVNIAIDTAQAIIGLWANPGFPAAIPLAVLVGGLGIAQAAIVNAQEIPQYWMGGVHDGGKMMINDGKGANWKETYVTPDGKIHQSDKRNAIVDAPKGTKIYTHDQWLDHQREISLHNMLKANNIDMYSQRVENSGMTKDDLYEVMYNTLGRQPISKNVWDERGYSNYTERKGNITRKAYNRAKGKS